LVFSWLFDSNYGAFLTVGEPLHVVSSVIQSLGVDPIPMLAGRDPDSVSSMVVAFEQNVLSGRRLVLVDYPVTPQQIGVLPPQVLATFIQGVVYKILFER
jgi:hypothetical protein